MEVIVKNQFEEGNDKKTGILLDFINLANTSENCTRFLHSLCTEHFTACLEKAGCRVDVSPENIMLFEKVTNKNLRLIAYVKCY